MKALRYSMAIGLLVGLGACSNMMGGNTGQSSRATAMAQPTVAPDMVRQVQAKLRDAGYYKQGAVDGVWGSGTETAVRAFQHDHNLGGSGQLDVPTLQAMNLTGGPVNTTNTAPMDSNPDRTAPTQPMRTNTMPDNTRDNPNNPNYPNNPAPQAR